MDADLESFFDTMVHPTLMSRIEDQISDGRLLKLIGLFLSQEIIEGMKQWTPMGGTPQRAVISPLLANIYPSPLGEIKTNTVLFYRASYFFERGLRLLGRAAKHHKVIGIAHHAITVLQGKVLSFSAIASKRGSAG